MFKGELGLNEGFLLLVVQTQVLLVVQTQVYHLLS